MEPCKKRIKSIQLSIMSPATIRRVGVVNVDHTTLYEKCRPKPGSVNDMQMGVVDARLRCKTCLNNYTDCPGHPGKRELPEPVYHVAYIGTLVKLLRSICSSCLRFVLLDEDHAVKRAQGLPDKQKFALLTSLCKTKKKCAHCGQPIPRYVQHGLSISREQTALASRKRPAAKKAKTAECQVENPGGEPVSPFVHEPLTPKLVREFLLLVDKSVYETLGLRPDISHPADFVMETLLIMPPIARPTITYCGSARARGQDDLTQRLQDILKTVMRLRKPDVKDRERAVAQLQLQIATYMNNESSSGKSHLKRRSGRPTKSIVKRLKGKKGRFRGNLMGKRVNYCARAPISPDPNICVDEIGIPEKIALGLTLPEHVTLYNFEFLQRAVEIGANKINGAESVTRNGVKRMLHLMKHVPRLKVGDVVRRYLRNGDPSLVNRQPTLRQKSIMAHKVHVGPGKTIRLNPCCTTPYNGDFDGPTEKDTKTLTHIRNKSPRDTKEIFSDLGDEMNLEFSRQPVQAAQKQVLSTFEPRIR